MNEIIQNQNKETSSKSENAQAIALPAPPLIEIKESFKALIGTEVANEQIMLQFAEDYFQKIEKDAKKRFPNTKIGLRSILANTGEENLSLVSPERKGLVFSIKEIKKNGGDRKGLKTRITRPDIKRENHSETDMSAFYLKKMIEEVLRAKIDEIIPLVLIYDLEQTESQSIYEVEFPNKEIMKNSLLAIYSIDCNPLISSLN